MEINWFPGHMAKSMREIENNLAVADCVLYVLDARAVRSCFNPVFDKMLKIPVVYVINKSDTVSETVVKDWLEKLPQSVAVEGTNSSACKKRVLAAIKRVCAEVTEKQRKRGLNEHIRAVVLGVPNTGKSTVINSLCGKSSLVTGDKAGVTRSARWARVDQKLDILDTPGTLYPKITDRRVGENLAIIGSIRDEVLDVCELAEALISRLDDIDPSILESRYGKLPDGCGRLESVSRRRGFLQRGGVLDTERAASALIDDFRKGRLGKIALEYTNE